MTEKLSSPIRETDDAARKLGRDLLGQSVFATFSTLDPDTGWPLASRILLSCDDHGQPFTILSDLAEHTKALKADNRCSVMVGEPGKGDPLAHPRLTVMAKAELVSRAAQNVEEQTYRARLKEIFLADHPKSELYIDFGDFNFYRFQVARGYLNGGFGKAYILSEADMGISLYPHLTGTSLNNDT